LPAARSVHHAYHGALRQIDRLKAALATSGYDEAERMKVAEGLLMCWQEAGGYFAAEGYFDELGTRTCGSMRRRPSSL
jgi:hypothetical protein